MALLQTGKGKPACRRTGLGANFGIGTRKQIVGTVSVELKRQVASQLLMDGFVPFCCLDELPTSQPASGFQEIGLPYESDPAITKHVAEFLNHHCAKDGNTCLPDHVLFNGGVFKADGFRRRLLAVFDQWFGPSTSIQELSDNAELDHAVSRGACYYAWTKERGGTRIRGGVPSAYYVGIETSGLAIPGEIGRAHV